MHGAMKEASTMCGAMDEAINGAMEEASAVYGQGAASAVGGGECCRRGESHGWATGGGALNCDDSARFCRGKL